MAAAAVQAFIHGAMRLLLLAAVLCYSTAAEAGVLAPGDVLDIHGHHGGINAEGASPLRRELRTGPAGAAAAALSAQRSAATAAGSGSAADAVEVSAAGVLARHRARSRAAAAGHEDSVWVMSDGGAGPEPPYNFMEMETSGGAGTSAGHKVADMPPDAAPAAAAQPPKADVAPLQQAAATEGAAAAALLAGQSAAATATGARNATSSLSITKELGSAKESDVLRLGEGVGSLTYDSSPSGNRLLDREMRLRLRLQDTATIVVLVAAFVLTVMVSFLSVYQVSEDPSPALFYCDPKHYRHRLLCSSAEPDAFLQAFNTQPHTARLRIIGKTAEFAEMRVLLRNMQLREMVRQMRLRGQALLMPSRGFLPSRRQPWDPVLFDVSLDLSPFITGDGRLASDADAAALEAHLNTSNPLEVLLLQKRVEWACWEEIAENIKQRLRALGFSGEVEVRLEAQEDLLVYRNNRWQNFVRNRITQGIVVLSIIGWLVWVPYLWLRMRVVRVESRFKITLDASRYWDLVCEGLHATSGFQSGVLNVR